MRMPHQSKPVSRTAGEIAARGNITPQFDLNGCLFCLRLCQIFAPGNVTCILNCASSPLACGI
jgi:hypothetical protein